HEAHSTRALGLQRATDLEIFLAARERGAVVITKDSDFLALLQTHGTPPSVIWITCGNTSNARMREVLSRSLETAVDLIQAGESVVEITDE
ncbi:MAG: DUF5615 family PIN-like protein, partial [Rhodothermales bacterium]|nr:DUF5615 family PIN-like protein [Rhodothermales bacterium]